MPAITFDRDRGEVTTPLHYECRSCYEVFDHDPETAREHPLVMHDSRYNPINYLMEIMEQEGTIDQTLLAFLCPTCAGNIYTNSRTFTCHHCEEQVFDRGWWPYRRLDVAMRPHQITLDANTAVESRARMEVLNSAGNYVSVCMDCVPRCDECGYAISGNTLARWLDDPDSVYDNDGDVVCGSCSRDDGSTVHSYNYVPRLSFRQVVGNGDTLTVRGDPVQGVPYIGMELEMERAYQHAAAIHDLFPRRTVWLKTDGSLGEDGLELCTHPSTFEWWMEHFPFDAFAEISKMGALSYHTGSTGIHLHVSASSFSAAHLFKFLSFHYRNPRVCQVVGQRGSTTYCSWSSWLQTRPDVVKFAKDFTNGTPVRTGRYVAVNMSERNTIELRYFKGNLKPDRVIKNIEWVDAIYRWTAQPMGAGTADEKLQFEAMGEWLKEPEQQQRYPHLLAFFEERGITPAGTPTREPVHANNA